MIWLIKWFFFLCVCFFVFVGFLFVLIGVGFLIVCVVLFFLCFWVVLEFVCVCVVWFVVFCDLLDEGWGDLLFFLEELGWLLLFLLFKDLVIWFLSEDLGFWLFWLLLVKINFFYYFIVYDWNYYIWNFFKIKCF